PPAREPERRLAPGGLEVAAPRVDVASEVAGELARALPDVALGDGGRPRNEAEPDAELEREPAPVRLGLEPLDPVVEVPPERPSRGVLECSPAERRRDLVPDELRGRSLALPGLGIRRDLHEPALLATNAIVPGERCLERLAESTRDTAVAS